MIALSSVLKIHRTVAGNAVFTNIVLSGTGEYLTIMLKISIAVSCMQHFFSTCALFSKFKMLTLCVCTNQIETQLIEKKCEKVIFSNGYLPVLERVALAVPQYKIHFQPKHE